MPALREQDFDKLAARVVDRFLAGDAKLADAAAEEAVNARMNPDQIERLSQSANTMAFLRMMDARKAEGAGDMMHEFDPIDAKQVIKIVIDEAGVHVEPGPGVDVQGQHDPSAPGGPQHPGMPGGPQDAMELPDEMGAARDGLPPPEGMPGHEEMEPPEEAAAEGDDGGPKAPPPFGKSMGGTKEPPFGKKDDGKKAPPFAKKTKAKKDDKDKDDDKEEEKPETAKEASRRRRRMDKLAGIFEDQYRQADWVFEETLESLCGRFKRAHTDVTYDEFEKDAMAEHGGSDGTLVLNLIRETRGLPPLHVFDVVKTAAAMADHHVSTESPELHLFENLVKIAGEAKKLLRAIDLVRSQCA